MNSVSDREIINMMKKAAEKKCDDAIDKWWLGEYINDNAEIHKNISLWKKKKQRVSELCDMLKNNL